MLGCKFLECDFAQKEYGKEEHCIKHGIPCRNIRACHIYERQKSGKTDLGEIIAEAKAEALDDFIKWISTSDLRGVDIRDMDKVFIKNMINKYLREKGDK